MSKLCQGISLLIKLFEIHWIYVDNGNKIISLNNIISIMSVHDYLQDFRLLLYLSVSHSHSNQARSIPQVKTAN